MRSRSAIPFTALSALTAGLFLLDLAVGAVRIPVADVWAALTGGDCPQATAKIVVNIRLIKAVVALLAGAALSVSGLQMQTLFRNPLAGPYVLGISSGASLGVALVVLAGIGSSIGVAAAAWIGAAAVLLVIATVGHRIKDIMVILILGMMFSSGVGAVVQILQYLSREEALKAFVIWTMGSLLRRDGATAYYPCAVNRCRIAAGRMDYQTAQPAALRRGVRRDHGAEYPPLARTALSLDDAACRNGNRFLRTDRLHRAGHAPRRTDALSQRRSPRVGTGNDSFRCGGAAPLRPRFQVLHPADKRHHRIVGYPDRGVGGIAQQILYGMIQLHDFSIGYGERTLLHEVEAAIPKGSLTALIGRNGTGKSTLLRAIAGLNRRYTGEILLDGRDISDMRADEMAKTLAFVTTERTRIANLKCEDVVAVGRAPYTNWIGRMQDADREIVAWSLASVGMSDYARRTMDKMSDGECQRIMIARALAQQTPVILLDEPTSFLDLPNRYELCSLLARLAHDEGKCILFSTHELDIALSLADSIALIDPPQLVCLPTDEMRRSGCIERLFKNQCVSFDAAAVIKVRS